MKTSRRLTMCSKGGRDSRKEPFRQLPSMPTLRLQGRWLDEAGFAIGMEVGVQVMPVGWCWKRSGRSMWRSRTLRVHAAPAWTEGTVAWRASLTV